MRYKEKFIENYTKYIYKKYFISRLYEEKYISKFADYEIENMQNLYDYMMLDSKISSRFMYPDSGNYNLVDIVTQREYEDLERQINNLKSRKEENLENLHKTEQYHSSETYKKIKYIISKSHPDINSSKTAKRAWLDFMENLRNGNLEVLDSKYDQVDRFRVIDKGLNDEDYKLLYELTLEDLAYLQNIYPNNLEKLFKSKHGIDEKIKELKFDLQKSRTALNAIQTMYLQVYEGEGLES